jgi:hypothetical protein
MRAQAQFASIALSVFMGLPTASAGATTVIRQLGNHVALSGVPATLGKCYVSTQTGFQQTPCDLPLVEPTEVVGNPAGFYTTLSLGAGGDILRSAPIGPARMQDIIVHNLASYKVRAIDYAGATGLWEKCRGLLGKNLWVITQLYSGSGVSYHIVGSVTQGRHVAFEWPQPTPQTQTPLSDSTAAIAGLTPLDSGICANAALEAIAQREADILLLRKNIDSLTTNLNQLTVNNAAATGNLNRARETLAAISKTIAENELPPPVLKALVVALAGSAAAASNAPPR